MADFASGAAGATGTLMGAAMETAGYHTQSQLLDQFNGTLGLHLGGLLYLIAVLAALITLASGGSYRYGLWLLIGPPLFFFLVGERTNVAPANWEFGDRIHKASEVQRAINGVGGASDGERNVALFFKGWDRLVSGVVQELITLLHLTEKGSDLDFLQKSDLYYNFWTQQTIDPTLKGFINMALINRCAQYYYALKVYHDPDIPQTRKLGVTKYLSEHADGKDAISVNLADQQWFREWLNTIFNGEEQIQNEYTCQQVWELAMKAYVKVQATPELRVLFKQNLTDGQTSQMRESTLDQKGNQIIHNGLTMQNNGGAQQAVTQQMINELAARVLSKEFFSSSKDLIGGNMSNFPELVSMENNGGLKFSEENNQAIRTIHGGDEYIHRGELIGAALTMPYIQGLVLYFLAVAYPFFAIMVIVPGRENGMLVWMSLWLWIKLWDFGFAVVKMIDNMLYALLPHGQAMTEEQLNDPGAVFRILFETDPTYSAHTYYNLMATCLFAVPIITGLFVIGIGAELVGAVSQGWKEYPTQMGGSMGTFNRALYNNENAGKAQRYILKQVRDNAWNMVVNDPEVLDNLLSAATNRFSKEGLNQFVTDLKSKMKDGNGAQVQKMIDNFDPSGKIIGAIADASASQNATKAMAKLQLNLHTVAFEASKSDYMRSLAGFSVMMRYNSHDFSLGPPGPQALRWEMAKRQNVVVGKVADSVVGMYYNALTGK